MGGGGGGGGVEGKGRGDGQLTLIAFDGSSWQSAGHCTRNRVKDRFSVLGVQDLGRLLSARLSFTCTAGTKVVAHIS